LIVTDLRWEEHWLMWTPRPQRHRRQNYRRLTSSVRRTPGHCFWAQRGPRNFGL